MKMSWLPVFVALLFFPPVAGAETNLLWNNIVRDAAMSEGVDPHLLASIAFVESRKDIGEGGMVAWPYAVRSPAGSQFFLNLESAASHIDRLLSGKINPAQIDVGPFQVNIHYGLAAAKKNGLSIKAKDLLAPKTNAVVAAIMLRVAIVSAHGDLELGVGRYHSWRTSSARSYGKRVMYVFNYIKGRSQNE